MITRNCVHRSSPNWVLGKGSDNLQLITFWPSRAQGKGIILWWGEIIAYAILQVFASL